MIDKILEELYRAGTHKMFCTEPHHNRSIETAKAQLKAEILKEVIGENNGCGFCGDQRQSEQRAKLTELFEETK